MVLSELTELSEGTESQMNIMQDVILLQTFMGLAMVCGTVGFGFIMVNRSKQCVISPQYLLQISLLGIGETQRINLSGRDTRPNVGRENVHLLAVATILNIL